MALNMCSTCIYTFPTIPSFDAVKNPFIKMLESVDSAINADLRPVGFVHCTIYCSALEKKQLKIISNTYQLVMSMDHKRSMGICPIFAITFAQLDSRYARLD